MDVLGEINAALIIQSDSGENSSWLEDGSGDTQSAGDSVWVKEDVKQNQKLNALYKKWSYDVAKDNVKCFEIVVDEGTTASVGVTTKSKFGQGYKCKGLLFHGNLSDGGALVEGNWGPNPIKGDKVGVRLSVNSCRSEMSVHYFLNGRALGCAFKESVSDLSGELLYPLVSFRGKIPEKNTFVQVPDPETTYSVLDRQQATVYEEHEDDVYKGLWVSKSINDSVTDKIKLTISTHKYEGTLFLSAKIANILRTVIAKEGEVWCGDGRVTQTFMMPSEDLVPIETAMTSILNNLHGMTLSNNNELLTIYTKDGLSGSAMFIKDVEGLKVKTHTVGVFK